jgi:hypothetical protein
MEDRFIRMVGLLMKAVVTVFVLCLMIVGSAVYMYHFYDPRDFFSEEEKSKVTNIDLGAVENGIHVLTGLKADANLELVIANCTGCHSGKLIAQNRATKEGWKNTITWMQETQNLWDLGANEEKILEYLGNNYAPEQSGRRKPLENIEWYELK